MNMKYAANIPVSDHGKPLRLEYKVNNSPWAYWFNASSAAALAVIADTNHPWRAKDAAGVVVAERTQEHIGASLVAVRGLSTSAADELARYVNALMEEYYDDRT